MSCPNCGAYRGCYCTWDEKARAVDIIRRRQAEFRRQIGRPTVIEEETERLRRKESPNCRCSSVGRAAVL